MNWKELPAKKTMKLLTLLLTSLLIASVSAAVYYSLTMDAVVTTTAVDVQFTTGDDDSESGASISGDGTYVGLASLKAYPNATLTYDSAVNITNSGSSAEFRLKHKSITENVNTSDFNNITFALIAPNGTQYGGAFTYDNTDGDDVWSTPSDMSYMDILAGEEWAVKVITKATTGITPGSVCVVSVYVDVR